MITNRCRIRDKKLSIKEKKMRLYTIESEGKEYVAVEAEAGMLALDSLDIKVKEMNELICRYDELKDVIKSKCKGAAGKEKVNSAFD